MHQRGPFILQPSAIRLQPSSIIFQSTICQSAERSTNTGTGSGRRTYFFGITNYHVCKDTKFPNTTQHYSQKNEARTTPTSFLPPSALSPQPSYIILPLSSFLFPPSAFKHQPSYIILPPSSFSHPTSNFSHQPSALRPHPSSFKHLPSYIFRTSQS